MEDNLLKVKHVFDKVKDMRSELNLLFNHLDGRICKLSEIYDEFIKNTNMIRTPDVKVLIFSLDSFYFQNSLLRREYKYLKDYYNIIINRMYGEYYKLFKLIIEYINRNLTDNKLNEVLKNKNYPRYDDLDDEKVYDFKLITQINEDIMNIINYLINILRDKETSLRQYTTNQEYGLNVNNFVSTYKYEVIVLQEQISLYEKYLDFFYHVHEKLLQRLITKVSVLEAQLNADIKFEGGLIGKKKDSKVLFDELGINGLNKKTARELRKSITGQYSPLPIEYDTESDENIILTNTSLDSDTNSVDSLEYIHPMAQSTLIEPVQDNQYEVSSVAIKLFNVVENEQPSVDEEEQEQDQEQSDKPSADQEQSDKPSADQEQSDKPSADQEQSDKPLADQEQSDIIVDLVGELVDSLEQSNDNNNNDNDKLSADNDKPSADNDLIKN